MTDREFKREERYIVLKLSDVEHAQLSSMERNALKNIIRYVAEHRQETGKQPLYCVIVESDWPEYEPTWKAIERRMTGISEPAEDVVTVPELPIEPDIVKRLKTHKLLIDNETALLRYIQQLEGFINKFHGGQKR